MKIKYLLCAILLVLFVSSNLVLSEVNYDETLRGERNDRHDRRDPRKPTRLPKPKPTTAPPKPKPTTAPPCQPIECPPGQGPIKLGTNDCTHICSSDACKNITCSTEIVICKPDQSPTGCCPCRH